jgi:hypothetical protein
MNAIEALTHPHGPDKQAAWQRARAAYEKAPTEWDSDDECLLCGIAFLDPLNVGAKAYQADVMRKLWCAGWEWPMVREQAHLSLNWRSDE